MLTRKAKQHAVPLRPLLDDDDDDDLRAYTGISGFHECEDEQRLRNASHADFFPRPLPTKLDSTRADGDRDYDARALKYHC